jgi:hypothetical protein
MVEVNYGWSLFPGHVSAVKAFKFQYSGFPFEEGSYYFLCFESTYCLAPIFLAALHACGSFSFGVI